MHINVSVQCRALYVCRWLYIRYFIRYYPCHASYSLDIEVLFRFFEQDRAETDLFKKCNRVCISFIQYCF